MAEKKPTPTSTTPAAIPVPAEQPERQASGVPRRLFRLLFGRPLATGETEERKVGAFQGVPILGLDALGSASYGPEAALAILIPVGVLGPAYGIGVILIIVGLLALLYFSYRQTIDAYPNGGGSFTVAKENLGRRAGLIAAASLMLDYILNVAVGISAGEGALESAFPPLQHYRLGICLVVLALITIINLRGVRESGIAWSLPTYGFLVTLTVVLLLGIWKSLHSGGHPAAVIAPASLKSPVETVSTWLLMRAFASGCTAMTGVEAVSNGVPIFAEPRTQRAKGTLTIISGSLGALLLGIGYLAMVYHVGALDQDKPGYQSVISQIVSAVSGRGVLYFVAIGCVLAVLTLSANTSFADFPRLCSLLAQDRDLPSIFGNLGRRLVFTAGILILAVFSGGLLILFGGVTDRLIPLFAVGAFGAFTMSQAGMVVHWRRLLGKKVNLSLVLNGMGAIATCGALIVIAVAKFVEGAWVVVILIPALVVLFESIHRHYDRLQQNIGRAPKLQISKVKNPIVVLPIHGWNRVSERAMRFALRISNDIVAIHVTPEEEEKDLYEAWSTQVQAPCRDAGIPVPNLEIIHSPYRQLIEPILAYVDQVRENNPERTVAVLIPELVQPRWWEFFLHSNAATTLKAALFLKRDEGVIVINTPWYYRDDRAHPLPAE